MLRKGQGFSIEHAFKKKETQEGLYLI